MAAAPTKIAKFFFLLMSMHLLLRLFVGVLALAAPPQPHRLGVVSADAALAPGIDARYGRRNMLAAYPVPPPPPKKASPPPPKKASPPPPKKKSPPPPPPKKKKPSPPPPPKKKKPSPPPLK